MMVKTEKPLPCPFCGENPLVEGRRNQGVEQEEGVNILALDLGTKCGWALRCGDEIFHGVQDFALRRGESPGMRYLAFVSWLSGVAVVLDPKGKLFDMSNAKTYANVDLVAYELPHMRGGHASEVLHGFATHLQAFCAQHGIEHASCHTATLKKFATGSGRGDKDAMIEAAGRFAGEPIADDNEADAICLLRWARAQYEVSPQEGAAR